MKITIEHNGIKRQIDGSGFNICGSPEDLLNIAEQIKTQIESRRGFGWIKIRDAVKDEHFAGPNTLPQPWGN